MCSRIGAAAALAAAFAIPLAPVAEACTPANRAALLILDLSDSMTAKVPSGETRVEIARKAVEQVVAVFPPEGRLALRVYGSETPAAQMDCRDSRLLVPFAAAGENKQAIIDAIYTVRPRGMTPIAFALDQARKDFPADVEDRVIVVVSDGRETCGANPCASASALAAEGFVIHSVGLVVDRTAALQLKCLATVSGGTYLDVPNALELPDKLKELFEACKISGLRPGEAPSSPTGPFALG
jgi:Ca-activated chloride channel family protein